jgi:hypothetical protein
MNADEHAKEEARSKKLEAFRFLSAFICAHRRLIALEAKLIANHEL